MSALPTAALASQSDTTRLFDLLAQVPDRRARRGVRHPVAVVLAVGIAAVVAGARSFTGSSQSGVVTVGRVRGGSGRHARALG
jgi:hypothetical protein